MIFGMENILLCIGLAFLITYFAIPAIIDVAKNKKLFDEPDERKVHKAVIPTLGGLGIFAGFIIATLLTVPPGISNHLQYFMAAALVIFFLGIKDDILILSATKKFIGQLIAAGIIIKFGGIEINNMHGLFGIHEIPAILSVILTAFTIIVITNSFNLIDGVDGLAGSLGLVTALVFGTYFFVIKEIMFAVMALSIAGSLAAFLIYNFSPARIFMGDTGSLLLGLLNSIFVIKFISTSNNDIFPVASAPAIGFAILIVPLFDTLRVFSMRLINRRSPFSPDRNHIHHFLLELGLSHRMISIICVSSTLLFIAISYGLRSLGTTMVIGALVIAAILFVTIVYLSRPRITNLQEIISKEEETIVKTHKVFSLAPKALKQEQL